MYTLLADKLIYPICDMVVGTSLTQYYHRLQETQWWAPAQLIELQNQKLRKLIQHAYSNVPYYGRLFANRGLTYDDIQTIDDLQKLPILTKDIIQKNLEQFKAKDFNKWKPILDSTSGSSGTPLTYFITLDLASMNWAGTYRGWNWAGYQLGDKVAFVGGSSLLPLNMTFKSRVRSLIERRTNLSSFGITNEHKNNFLTTIKNNKIHYIYGYPSTIAEIADYGRRSGINGSNVKAIFTTAEKLLVSQRQSIQDYFQCEVLDMLGSYDGGLQVIECIRHTGYHITSEKVIVEYIARKGLSAGDGIKEMVVIDLHNYAMPFIRYATGDLAVPSDKTCTCGRGLPLLRSIEGRTINFIHLKDGTKIPGLPLTDVFEHIEMNSPRSFKKYRIIQTDVNNLVVQIVKGPNHSKQNEGLILNEFRKHLGTEQIDVLFEYVDSIPLTTAGKNLLVQSMVESRCISKSNK